MPGSGEKAHELECPAQSQSLQGRSKPWEPAMERQLKFVGHLKEACLCWAPEVVPKRACSPQQRRRRCEKMLK